MVRLAALLAAVFPALAQTPLDNYLNAEAERLMKARVSAVASLSRASAQERQKTIRASILASIGGLPKGAGPLNARVTGTLDRAGYRVENIVFESLPRFFVTANVYIPKNGRAPFPAVVGVAGHSNNGKASATYQHVWISLARRGYVVIAIDPPGQGERGETIDEATGLSRAGIGTQEHTLSGLQCLLTGNHIAQYIIHDGMRAIDYLLTRKDVDATRIAVAGNSGGGTQTAYLAALEERLAAAVSSCYMTSWRQLWYKPGPQDGEQVFPNFLRDGLDFSDFAFSFAPRPFLMTTAIQDFFPIDGARAAFAEIRSFYNSIDASGKAGYFEFDDTHGWSKPRREAAYRWLDQWLLGRETVGGEGDVETEQEQNLYATATGQLRTSLGGETTQSLNARKAVALLAARGNAAPQLPVVAKRIALTLAEPRLYTPALTVPETAAAKVPAVLAMNATKVDLAALQATGWMVASIQRPPGVVQQASRAFLLGKTLLGFETAEVIRAVTGLVAHPRVDASRIRIYARGNASVAALHAAFLDSRIQSIALEAMPLSWHSITQAKMHRGLADIIVPGALLDYDLPDLAKAVAPRVVWLVDTRDAMGATLLLDAVKRDYPSAHAAYRPEGWKFQKVYSAWLN
ncbi:MAG: acetylxylan esterase [Candidatus Solibacter usitatus]|nr:acetylxylan esterase [Candidatus Solibacter usitatus]